MNPENLKQITELIAGLGSDTKEAFMIYIGFLVMKELLYYGTIMVVGFAIAKFIGKPVANEMAATQVLRAMRDEAEIGSPGELVTRELQEIRKKWREACK